MCVTYEIYALRISSLKLNQNFFFGGGGGGGVGGGARKKKGATNFEFTSFRTPLVQLMTDQSPPTCLFHESSTISSSTPQSS